MKKLLLSFLLCFIFFTNCFSQSGWYSVTPPITDLWLQRIQFTSINTGYAIGPHDPSQGYKSYILKTTNTGNNWTSMLLDTLWINSMYFVNDNTGYIFGEQSWPGIIKKTTDGGNSWVTQALNQASVFFVGQFFDANTGYVAGKYGRNHKTTDGGNTWVLKYSSNILWFDDLYFLNENTGFGVDSKIFKTTDGGDTWFQNYDNYGFYSIHFINNLTGYAGGQAGVIVKTTNAGDNWIILDDFSNCDIRSIYFKNVNTGFASTRRNAILKTTNAGVNWTEQIIGTPYTGTYSVFFLNETTGFTGFTNGVIMKTTNGGNVFINPVSNSVPDKYSLSQNYPNPFNPTTNIKFSIPKSDNVTLKVYNLLGNEVATLVNEKLQPGNYEVKFDGTNLPSGVYYYRIETESYSETKKMLLIK